jgi:hypothetical protein
VIERLEGMAGGTIGFRVTGRVTREEFLDVLEPPLRAAVEAGEVRMVFALGPGFEGLDLGALAEDTKAALSLGFGHVHAWKRLALVTDVDWVARAWHMFAWMTPAEVGVYPLDRLDDAKAWVAG